MLRKLLLLLLLSIATLTFANEEAPPLANTDGEFSALVNNCVSAITGDLLVSETDLVIPGPEPLAFTRLYSSGDGIKGLLGQSWIHAFESRLFLGTLANEDKLYIGQYLDIQGSSAYYNGNVSKHGATYLKFEDNPGYSNTGKGLISGKTNLRNTFIHIMKKGSDDLFITNGAGDTIDYSYSGNKQSSTLGTQKIFLIQKLRKPNGNLIHYTYDKTGYLTDVKVTDGSQTVEYGSVNIDISRVSKKGHIVKIKGSDKRIATYQFSYFNNKVVDKEVLYLTSVDSPNAPPESYEYKEFGLPRLTRRNKPADRFLEIDYYAKGNNTVRNEKIKIKDGDYRRFNVKFLKAPVGVDSNPQITHTFVYDRKSEKNKEGIKKFQGGRTDVYDAHDVKTSYSFTNEHRLTEIAHFKADNVVVNDKEKFIWDPSPERKGNLLGRILEDGEGKVLCARTYDYDASGNITTDKFYGDITGQGTSIKLGENGLPISGECFYKNSTYGYMNTLITEEELNSNIKTYYQYKHATDLLTSKLICEGDSIKQREFREYDAYGTLIKTIQDDGCTGDSSDTQGVTERHITYITLKSTTPCLGIPLKVEERYWDPESGEEKLLKRLINTYSDEGWLITQEVIDAHEQSRYTLKWTYNEHGKVLSQTDPMGHIIRKKYDANDNLTEETSPQGLQKVYTYDFSNRLIVDETINGHQTLKNSFGYDHLSRKVKSVDPLGQVSAFFYDEFGHETAILLPPQATPEGSLIQPSIHKTYNAMGHLISTTDPKGHETTIKSNVYGKPLEIFYPDGSHESFVYNLNGTLKASTAKNGSITFYTYDYQKRPTTQEVYSSTGELLSRITHTYNAFHLLSTTDAKGNVTSYKYDGAGRQTAVISGDTIKTTTYDALGRPYRVQEGNTVKELTYDLNGQILEEQIQNLKGDLLRKTGYRYDLDGYRTHVIAYPDGQEAVTVTEYDLMGQPIKVIDAEGKVYETHYNYDFRNQYQQQVLQKIEVDPQGLKTITTFDAQGRIATVEKQDPFSNFLVKQEIFYDLSGHKMQVNDVFLTTSKEKKILITKWTTNPAGQVLEQIEAVDTPNEKRTTFHYNSYGEKETVTKPDGTQLFHEYDPLGRLSRLTSSDGTIAYQYTYDRNHNPVQILDELTGKINTRTYDEQNRLLSETLANGLSVSYAYDGQGRMTQLTLPDQTTIHYTYDAAYLKQIHFRDLTFEYHYDLAGNVKSLQFPGNAHAIHCTYDRLCRLKNIEHPLYSEKELSYDDAGNLIGLTVEESEKVTACRFAYDPLYQLKQEEGHFSHTYGNDTLYNRQSKDGAAYTLNTLNQVLNDADATYTYDSNGNLTHKQSQSQDVTYTYDALDRLIAITLPQCKITYTYDSFHRRLSKTVDYEFLLESKTVYYLYQGDNEIGTYDQDHQRQELRVLGVGKGAEIGAAVLLELYGDLYVPLHDHNGNVTTIMDLQGHQLQSYHYTAFGEEEEPLSYPISPWRFSSKRVEPETGLVYFGRRYYDPNLGRWITPDPQGFKDGPNLYAYVHNSPLTHFDLYGLFDEVDSIMPNYDLSSHRYAMGGILKYGFREGMIGGDWRRHFESAGNWYKNGDWKYDTTYYDEKPSRFPIGSNQSRFGDEIIVQNGIHTSKYEFQTDLYKFSNHLGNKLINGCHAPTYGFANDIFGAAFWSRRSSQLGWWDPHRQEVDNLKAQIYESYGRLSKDGYILTILHSKGTQVGYQAIMELPHSIRDRMAVIGIAPAEFIPTSAGKCVWNYACGQDDVCKVGVSRMNSYSEYNVKWLEAKSSNSTSNHTWTGPTYFEPVVQATERFLNRTGEFECLK